MKLSLILFAGILALAASRCHQAKCHNHAGKKNVFLKPGQRLTAENGSSYLIMQEDGNLVLYCTKDNRVAWASNTRGKNELVFQEDGNLVMYSRDPKREVKWQAGSHNKGAIRLHLQNDGNLVIYNAEKDVWATNTNGKCN